MNSAADELHPALSADGRFLAFTRMTLQPKPGAGAATPGIQTIVNPPLDIGADAAPTPLTRQFQSVYGGLAVAESNESTVAPRITCTASCINALLNAGQPPLKPKLSFTTAGQTVGIFVVRVTGKRELLGRSVPKVRLVGRGRALKRDKVLNTSDSIRFTVTKSGKARNPRRQR